MFMRGTQLKQLSDEYQICLQNIRQTTVILAQKKEALPDLKQALDVAKSEFQEADRARQLLDEFQEYKNELAWAHVKVKEDVCAL